MVLLNKKPSEYFKCLFDTSQKPLAKLCLRQLILIFGLLTLINSEGFTQFIKTDNPKDIMAERNSCPDFPNDTDLDGDGIVNGCDLDDDNDGILDTDEGQCTTLVETGTWTESGGNYVTTVDGIEISTSITTVSPASHDFFMDNFANMDFWERDLKEHEAMTIRFIWDEDPELEDEDIDDAGDDKGSGTITFTFSQPVTNPILHLDRIGGNGNAGITPQSNSVELTLTTPNIALSLIEGTEDFEVLPNRIRKVPDIATTDTEEADNGMNIGTAAGSVRVLGTITSISFDWTGVGVEGLGYEGVEFIWSTCGSRDTDGDSIYDFADLDSDNDGISDLIESGQDHNIVDNNNDGQHDGGVDNDGVPNEANGGVTPDNTDGDVVTNFIDLDSDNDGIPDNIESQVTTGYSAPTYVNNATNNGVNDNGLFVPINKEGTGNPDYLDLDSEDDGKTDEEESGLNLAGNDANADGIDDGVGATYADVNGIVNDPTTDLENEFGDTEEVAYREACTIKIEEAGPFCIKQGLVQLIGIPANGIWTGTGVSASGEFDPAEAGIGTHIITYSLGKDCSDQLEVSVGDTSGVKLTPVDTLCLNGSEIQLEASVPGGVWNGDNVTADGVFDPKAAGIGTHKVIYTLSGVCVGKDSMEIVVRKTMEVNFVPPVAPTCLMVNTFEAKFEVNGISIDNIIWDFGDGSDQIFNETKVTHIYDGYDTYRGEVLLQDTVCGVDSIIPFVINFKEPSRAIADIDVMDSVIGCEPFLAEFINNSNTTEHLWIFGDGDSSTVEEPNHYFEEPGVYTIIYQGINPAFCIPEDADTVQVRVYRTKPLSGKLKFDKPDPCESTDYTLEVKLEWDGESTDVIFYDFDGDGTADTILTNDDVYDEVKYTYTKEGKYEIIVTAFDKFCNRDTTMTVDLLFERKPDPEKIVCANIFTPNGDKINDHFKLLYNDNYDIDTYKDFLEYDVTIYNRWGNKLYETGLVKLHEGHKELHWDGKSRTGSVIPDGIYFYLVTFKLRCYDGEDASKSPLYKRNGHVQIQR